MGLRQYGEDSLAREIALRTAEHTAAVAENTGTFSGTCRKRPAMA